MNPNEISNLTQQHTSTNTSAPAENLEITTTDFLIGSMSVFMFALATYLLVSTMYPSLLPMPQYVSLQHMQMVEYKKELLKQSGVFYVLSMVYMIFLHVLRVFRAKA